MQLARQVAELEREVQYLTATINGKGGYVEVQKMLNADVERLTRECDLAKRLVSRLPMCQDHRDKFPPDQCQACRAERAETKNTRLLAVVDWARRYRDRAFALAHHSGYDPGEVLRVEELDVLLRAAGKD